MFSKDSVRYRKSKEGKVLSKDSVPYRKSKEGKVFSKDSDWKL